MAKTYKLSVPKPMTIAEPRVAYGAGKQRLNVTVRADLIERAREQGLNLSSVLEETLTERLRKAEGERWLTENAQAIAHHKARIAKDGMWNRDMIRF